MPGTREGGRQAARTNKQRYGRDFYITIGRMGGEKSTGGGFAKDPELAARVGRIGGLRSRKRHAGETKPCKFEGCRGQTSYYSQKGYCRIHLQQLARTGKLTPIQPRLRRRLFGEWFDKLS